MSSTAADVHPALPPIRTTAAAAPEPACSSAASSSTAPAPDAESVALPAAAEKQHQQQKQGEAGSEAHQEQERERERKAEAEAEPTTPTSEGSRLRPLAECPPAPRKPAWAPPPRLSTPAKRKLPSSGRSFFPVARDLTTVFQALPPPKKRTIRAG